jgi:hypothetical protein
LRGTIAPLLKSDEETLNNQWLPLFGLDPTEAFLAYDNPVPADKVFERESLKQQVDGGRITINDANELDGLDPVEGGDVPRVNGVPLDQVGALPEPTGFTFNAGPTHTDNKFVIERDGEPQPLPIPAKTLETPDPVSPVDTNVGRYMDKCFNFAPITKVDAANDAREGQSDTPGRRMMRDLGVVFRDAENVLLAGMGAGGAVDVDALLATFEKDIFDATLEPITASAGSGASVGLADIGVSPDVFNVTNPRVAESIENFNLRLAGEVTQTTVSAIKDTIAQGVEAGENVDQLRQRVVDTGKFSPERAESIARTESARGFVKGEELGWQESGVVSKKKWLLAPGACPYCVEASKGFNKDGGTALGESFLKVGDVVAPPGKSPMTINFASIGGPPLHPNDRCDIIAVID